MTDVTLIFGLDPGRMVPELLESLNPFQGLAGSSRILIKPNLVVGRREWKGVDTDPRVVEQVVIHLKDRGMHNITVADGAGMGHTATDAFSFCGYTDMAKKYDIKLLDLDNDKYVQKTPAISGPFSKLKIAETAEKSDYIVNIPVMKAHSQTKMTCSLKNMKGVLPRQLKTAFHSRDLEAAIAQLNSIIKPDFTLVDGTYGDLRFETGHTPVEIGMMLAGFEPIAVDCVAAEYLGFKPTDIRHITESLRARNVYVKGIKKIFLNTPAENRTFKTEPADLSRYPCRIDAGGVCCTCQGNLLFALERLEEDGRLDRSQHLVIGQQADSGHTISDSGKLIALGKCAVGRVKADIAIPGCPVKSSDIVDALS
jgi:uncharacterized protein (DUF362 family)